MDFGKALGLGDSTGEENTVSLEIYPASSDLAASELATLQTQLLDHLRAPFLQGYIWQRDRFDLQLSTQRQAPWQQRGPAGGSRRQHSAAAAAAADGGGQASSAAAHLWGSMSFGDNIDDEWFIVWLLLELTRAFPVTARVWDNDGEFLLIEAAYGLPRWLKPETAQNRVWLHGGTFHLVPLPRFAGDPLLGATPSLVQALAAVRGSQISTEAPPKLQAALLPRVSGFPGRAAEQMHVAHALLPARVAHLLRQEPQLLAAAVEAFHYRDVDDVKVASRMAVFPPQQLVMAAPTFSRCLYAQLALQDFAPPRVYPMPMPTDPQFKAAEVGMKLTAGFEMMYANRARFGSHVGEQQQEEQQQQQHQRAAGDGRPGDASAGNGGGSSGRASEASLAGDASWAAFKARLESSGYFRGSLPGSVQHKELSEAAVGSYRQTEAYRRSTAALAAPAAHVDQLLLRQPVDAASFPPASQLPPEGSEAWLHAEAGQKLEAELQQRQREFEREQQHKQARHKHHRNGSAADGGGEADDMRGDDETGASEEAPEYDPRQLASRLRAFVDAMSGLEGAEVPPPQQAGSGGDSPGDAGDWFGGGGGGGVALDDAKFAAELQRVLGLGRGLGLTDDGDDGGMSQSTSEEGSSFFSDNASSQEDLSDEDEEQQQQQQRQGQPPGSAAAAGAAGASQSAAAAAAGAAHTAGSTRGQQREQGGEQQQQQPEQEGWEADTETDSDDDAQFMAAYGRAMDVQLAGSRMAESFERAPAPAGAAAGTAAAAAAAAGGQQQQQQQRSPPPPGGVAAEAEEGEVGDGTQAAEAAAGAGLRPVDIDMNLVHSLLASYEQQQGLPGPAGSLAGLLGLKLPHQTTG